VPQEAVTYVVDPAQAGERLDVYLAARLRWRSRTKVQELIEVRDVTVDGVRRDRAYRVKAGEQIAIPLPPPPEDAFRIGEIPLEILHEDDYLIVLNKPPGIVVHPVGKHRYNTLINALHLRYRNLEDASRDIVPKLAHRIDRDTSGVLVAVKTGRHERGAPVVFERLEVRKEYLAIAEGVLAQEEGEINLPLGPAPVEEVPGLSAAAAKRRTSRQAVTDDGRPALTRFTVRERFAGFTLLHLRIVTGRQHQIRVHLQASGHPVLCDAHYGVRRELRLSEARRLRPGEEDTVLIARQALHSWRLAFPHPATGQDVTFEAPLPGDMARALDALREGALEC